jgi:hypothetical protein
MSQTHPCADHTCSSDHPLTEAKQHEQQRK